MDAQFFYRVGNFINNAMLVENGSISYDKVKSKMSRKCPPRKRTHIEAHQNANLETTMTSTKRRISREQSVYLIDVYLIKRTFSARDGTDARQSDYHMLHSQSVTHLIHPIV